MAGADPFHHDGHGACADVGVLLVHGITATPQMVRPVAEHLAGLGYAVSAPLLPGHGTTWQLMGRTRYDDWLAAVEGAAADLATGRRRVVAFGVSLGGALVCDLAQLRPDLIDGLVLVNPAFAAKDWRLTAMPLLKHVLPRMPGLADDIRREGPPRELAYTHLPLKAFHSFIQQWPRLVAGLPRVHVPVLLARSAHDHVVPARSSEVFLQHVGSSDVTQLWLHESAHVATLDHDAELLQQATAEFVARVGAAA